LPLKRIVLYFAFTLCFQKGAFSQFSPDHPDIVNKLKNYFAVYDPEKAYLQLDKPYYAAGDTLYFKAYVTQGGHHQLSGLSGVLHVDFINPKNKIDQSIKLHLDSGVCWGDFALPDSLPAGNYRIRAYTEWMLNSGEVHFFDRTVSVASLKTPYASDGRKKPPSEGKKNGVDTQFFPEGGTLVQGVQTKMAFKCTGTNGLGIGAKGEILDKDNKTVCSFKSSHLGMGYFFFIPEKDNVYKASISFADGTRNLVDLPKPEPSGISLSVVYDSGSAISFRIAANPDYSRTNGDKDFLLVICSGEKIMSYSFKQDAPVVLLSMDSKLLQTGVSAITLFSPDGEPLCERLLFVQNKDLLRLKVQTDKIKYQKKEKVNLLLNAKGPTHLPVKGHFSVAVVDESQMPAEEKNERNMLTYLLLTSDLKGYVEQPNYYFKDSGQEAKANLDLLMLTQGYRQFEWKQVLGNDSDVLTFKPERGLEINGKITNLNDKPISDGTVTLIPARGGPLLSSKSDSMGLFHFSGLVFTDTMHLVLSAVNAKGSNSTRIEYFNANHASPFVSDKPYVPQSIVDTNLFFYLGRAQKWREELIAYNPGKYKMLKPVTVMGFKLDNQYRTQSLAGAGHADQVMHADEIGMIGGQLSTSLNGRLYGVSFIGGIPYLTANGTNVKSPMLLVIDGTEILAGNSFDINEIPTSQVETVEVLKYANASIYGMDGAGGVLVITTKNGGEAYRDIVSVGVLPITPMGFYKARTFYSPKYDHAGTDSTAPDLRSTIYWNPEIKPNEDGDCRLDYYNAGSSGTYKVTVEGIDEDGNIGRVVYRYAVE
jgi:hypothetical protein